MFNVIDMNVSCYNCLMFNVVNVVNDGSSLLKTRPPINGCPNIGTDREKMHRCRSALLNISKG